MLLLLTIFSAVMAWKFNQRNRIRAATKQIEKLGGQVFYYWENPVVVVKPVIFRRPYRNKHRIKTMTLPDGTVQTYEAFGHRSFNHPFNLQVNSLESSGSSIQGANRFSFFGNEDIMIDSVGIDESDVDADFINQLRKLDNLRTILIYRDREYFCVYGTRPSQIVSTAVQQRNDDLIELEKPFENAKSMIHSRLPKVRVIDGYRSPVQSHGSPRSTPIPPRFRQSREYANGG